MCEHTISSYNDIVTDGHVGKNRTVRSNEHPVSNRYTSDFGISKKLFSARIMAKNMHNDGVLTASIVVATTLLASVTLTAWIFILRTVGWI